MKIRRKIIAKKLRKYLVVSDIFCNFALLKGESGEHAAAIRRAFAKRSKLHHLTTSEHQISNFFNFLRL